jgi:hypothetical protein
VRGSSAYDATQSNITVPSAPLTAITNTSLLTCQSNRFIDNSTNAYAVTAAGDASVQAFQPFPGATTWSGSVLGGSGYFDGTGDYLSAGTNAAFAVGTGDFTIEFWVYPTAFSGTYTGYFTTRTGGQGFDIQILNSSATLMLGNSTGAIISANNVLSLNTWQHVCAVRSGTTNSLYVNGTRVATGTDSTNFTDNGAKVGSSGPSGGNNCAGFISDVRLVKGTAVYSPSSSTLTVPTAPLTAITNTSLLTNFTNAGIFDSAMMNNLETVGNAQVSTSVVKYGTGSMAFDGSGDWLAGPPTPQTDLGSGDFTIEAWLYRTASGAASDSGMVSRGAPSTLNGFVFAYTSANVLTFNFNYSGAIVTGVTVIPANTWTHVAVSRNGNTFRLFVNGVVDATATSTNSQTTNASDVFYVGRAGYDSGRIVTGYLDDVRLTKGAARYIGNFTPPVARMPQQ